jgi:hypothetical protein
MADLSALHLQLRPLHSDAAVTMAGCRLHTRLIPFQRSNRSNLVGFVGWVARARYPPPDSGFGAVCPL